jgi:hypothetical protein
MSDDLPTKDRSELPAPGQQSSLPSQEQEIQAINAREELLLRAKGLSRRARERVWRAMGGEGVQGPHDRPPEAEVEGEPIGKQAPPNRPPSRP